MQHESRGWGGLEVTVQCSAHLRRTRILVGEAKNADRWNDRQIDIMQPNYQNKYCMFLMFGEKCWSYLDLTKLFMSLDSICNSWHENTTWLGLGKDHVSLLLPRTRQKNIRSSCEKINSSSTCIILKRCSPAERPSHQSAVPLLLSPASLYMMKVSPYKCECDVTHEKSIWFIWHVT